MKLVKSESFCDVQCDFWKDEQNQIYLTRQQIGEALEYKNPMIAIAKIHDRHVDRLNQFSVLTKLDNTHDGKSYDSYLYNSKGVYEICRWSRQPKADAFMDWVWNVLESIRKTGSYGTFKIKLDEPLTKREWLKVADCIAKTSNEALPLLRIALNQVAPGKFDTVQNVTMVVTGDNLAEKLSQFIKTNNLTLQEFAEKAQLPKSAVSMYCSGKTKNPTAKNMKKITTAMSCNL